jgi:outer membrane protein
MKMRGFATRLLLLGLAMIFVGADAPPVGAQAAKIGLVDLQRVVVESKKGQGVLAKLQAERGAKQKEIDGEDEKIRKMEADLAKQASVLSEAARKEREKAIRDRALALRRKVEDLSREFTEREREIRNRLILEIAEVVAAYGKENGFLLIMEVRAGGVMYGAPTADVTKEAIAAYDARKDSGKK